MGQARHGDTIRLGTRSSPLARWQADWVAGRLAEFGWEVELVPIKTTGDRRAGAISELGRQGVFTSELQQALLEERIDLAVHSLKDLPTDSPDDLQLAAVPPRGPAADVLIARQADSLETLPSGAQVATSSRRRRAQLLALRGDLEVVEIRGNVDTRLRKLDEGQFDGLVLAEAGVRRLALESRITQVLSPELMLPAIGQGALGLEIRRGDRQMRRRLEPLDDAPTRAQVTAERALLARLHAGCLAPLGALSWIDGGTLFLRAAVLRLDGKQRIEASGADRPDRAVELGEGVADTLLGRGAAALIDQARQGPGDKGGAGPLS